MSGITSRAARAGRRAQPAAIGPDISTITAHIEQTSIQYRPSGTTKEYDRLVEEYLQFAQEIYNDKRTDSRTLTVEHVVQRRCELVRVGQVSDYVVR